MKPTIGGGPANFKKPTYPGGPHLGGQRGMKQTVLMILFLVAVVALHVSAYVSNF